MFANLYTLLSLENTENNTGTKLSSCIQVWQLIDRCSFLIFTSKYYCSQSRRYELIIHFHSSLVPPVLYLPSFILIFLPYFIYLSYFFTYLSLFILLFYFLTYPPLSFFLITLLSSFISLFFILIFRYLPSFLTPFFIYLGSLPKEHTPIPKPYKWLLASISLCGALSLWCAYCMLYPVTCLGLVTHWEAKVRLMHVRVVLLLQSQMNSSANTGSPL